MQRKQSVLTFWLAAITVIVFSFCSALIWNSSEHDEELQIIAALARLLGGIYLVAGSAIGWIFIRKFVNQDTKRAISIGILSHSVSTLAAFYLFPVAVYLVVRTQESWLYAGLISLFTGFPEAIVVYFLLKFLLRLPIRRHDLYRLLIWQACTLALGVLIAAAYLLAFNNHAVETIWRLNSALAR